MIDAKQQTPIKVALFGKDAETSPKPNDVIRITNAYAYRRRQAHETTDFAQPAHSLGTRPLTQVEVGTLDEAIIN